MGVTATPAQPTQAVRAPHGPGTELKKLLGSLGLTTTDDCKCNSRAAEMDRKGAQWCREHRDEIIGWLKEEAAKRSWRDVAGAVLKAATGEFRPSILDPFGSLVDEAIRRSDAQ